MPCAEDHSAQLGRSGSVGGSLAAGRLARSWTGTL